MKYFVTNDERTSTLYHEFYRGKWDEETFWKEDSLYVHDNTFFDNQGFVEALVEVLTDYSAFGESEVTKEDWDKIGHIIETKSKACKEMYEEASTWAKEVFATFDCFTIIGI